MIICNLCQQEVEKFKTNSHIIPRWMIIEYTKENGRNTVLHKDESGDFANVKLRNQKDLIGDFICNDCEKKTSIDDGFSAEFFRDKKWLVKEELLNKSNNISCEYYNPRIGKNLKSFIISLILRYDAYLVSLNRDPYLGPYFDKVKNSYLKNMINYYEYPIAVVRSLNFDKILTTPYPLRYCGIKSITIDLVGYRFISYFGKSSNPEVQNHFLIKENSLNIYKIKSKYPIIDKAYLERTIQRFYPSNFFSR